MKIKRKRKLGNLLVTHAQNKTPVGKEISKWQACKVRGKGRGLMLEVPAVALDASKSPALLPAMKLPAC